MRFRDRALFLVLAVADRLLGTHWVQTELDRRWKRLTEYQAQMGDMQQEMARLESGLEKLQLQLCLIYLRHRHMMDLDNWLHFESGGSEEPGLDLLIEHLVKPQLAAVEMQETTPGHHVYHLRPYWTAIAAAIGEPLEALEPEIRTWLRQRMADGCQPTG
jgi:hypothetical protein